MFSKCKLSFMTKLITPIVFICFILISCTTDIEINTPALQATENGKLFRPSTRKAVIKNDGSLVISGNTGTESIHFTAPSSKTGTYTIDPSNEVTFIKENTSKYVSILGESEGEIQITEISSNDVSGYFHFKNLKDNKGNSTTFRNGWFYKIPIENESTEVAEAINPCLLDASLTANIDGTTMITDDHSANIFGVQDVSILISASNGTQEISIVFPINTTNGVYPLTGLGDYSASYALDNDKASAVSGRLTILSHNPEIKCISGSFEFTTGGNTVITEGIFDFGY